MYCLNIVWLCDNMVCFYISNSSSPWFRLVNSCNLLRFALCLILKYLCFTHLVSGGSRSMPLSSTGSENCEDPWVKAFTLHVWAARAGVTEVELKQQRWSCFIAKSMRHTFLWLELPNSLVQLFWRKCLHICDVGNRDNVKQNAIKIRF